MAQPTSFTKTIAAASANNIALSQTPAGAGNLTINGSAASGGVATLDTQRRLIITSAGNDSGRTFTVYGTNGHGLAIVDQFAGANAAAAQSNLDFLTVTRIAVDAATAGAVTAGTNTTGSSHWVRVNQHIDPIAIFIQCDIASGTPTYQIDYTMDDFWTPAPPVGVAVTPVPKAYTSTLSAQTGAANLTLTIPCSGWRVTLTAIGGVSVKADQAGITN